MDPQLLALLGKIMGPGGPYPLGPVTIGDQKYMNYLPPAPQTLVDLFNVARYNAKTMSSVFLVYGKERMTFAQVFAAVDALAAALVTKFNVKRGDRVAIAMRNLPELVVAYMATVSIAAIAVPLNGWWTGQEFEYALSDSGASVLFADQERFNRIAPYLAGLKLEGRTVLVRPSGAVPLGTVLYLSLLAAHAGARPAAGSTPVGDDDATIMYTSGTTGHPKGVLSSHESITAAVNSLGVTFALLDMMGAAKAAAEGTATQPIQDCILLAVPLFHCTATHAVFLPSFLSGRKMVMMYKWDALEAIKAIEAERVTHFTGVPTMSWEMLNHPDISKHDVSSMRFLSAGGAPTPPSMVGQVSKQFKNASPGQGFGMTESNAITTLNSAASYLAKPASCGRPAFNVQIRIADDEINELAVGSIGEILIRGPTLMKRYWRKPEATAETLVKDKDGVLWLRTGDIGKVDEDGFLYILDRKKDLIIRGGENISCSEVEAAVYEHPDVSEAAAFGLPDTRLGETVAVALVMKAGRPSLDVTSLAAFLKRTGKLASFKAPTSVFIWHEPELPRGATGKILKKDVRAYFAAAKPRSKL